jgi:signal peptidase I
MSGTLDHTVTPRGSRALRIAGITALTLLCLTTLTVIVAFVAHGKFSIPSTSMNPTLYIGDQLLVSRMMWDGELERGDVAVFDLNYGKDGGLTYYIKRIIGLPGDRIALSNGQIIINGAPVERRQIETRWNDSESKFVPTFEETLPGGRKITVSKVLDHGDYDTMAEITVPPGHYFVIGDNRDYSYDSRAKMKVGFVAREAFFGKAKCIFFSIGNGGIRFNRIGQRIR